MVNLEDAQRLIHGLRERGCQFALDDFGRDASSFFYLKHLPADFLKIDGAFVRGMLDDRRDQAIVRSIAKLASDFGIWPDVSDAAVPYGHRRKEYLGYLKTKSREKETPWGKATFFTSVP